ncbi:DNA polymerase III subunit gamma/tau [soil metagenome]
MLVPTRHDWAVGLAGAGTIGSMAYQSLYRRYRSERFAEVVGQDHVVGALRNAVRDGRVGHAYLFSGPRGTGKTSTARILAKALNCPNLVEGEPCGVCESCASIAAGTSYDLQELDAASNNGVEAMRELISRAAMGSPGRTKVYILDEVHMLSVAASNALLKTLEEPPGHLVFVLATTDPQKVLPTIRSRTQHFEFHLIAGPALAEHVRWVITDADLAVGDAVVDHVVRAGGGSARDTLSALDQVAAAGGVADAPVGVDDLVEALCESDTGAALAAVAESVRRGRDPRVLAERLLGRLRDVFLVRMGAGAADLSDAERVCTEGWAERLEPRTVTRALEALGEAIIEMRQAPDPRVPLEVALVRLTRTRSELDALVARIDALERSLADAGSVTASSPSPMSPPSAAAAAAPPARPPASRPAAPEPPPASPPPARTRPADAARAQLGDRSPAPSRPASPPKPAGDAQRPLTPPPPAAPGPGSPPSSSPPAPSPSPPSPQAPSPSRDELTLVWGDRVLPALPGLAKAMFSVGRFVGVDGGTAVFALPNKMHRDKCEEKRAEVEAVLAAELGRRLSLRLVVDDGQGPGPPAGAAPGGPGRGTASQGAAGNEEDHIDLSELVDAPDETRSGVEVLTEAFPGAEMIEDER